MEAEMMTRIWKPMAVVALGATMMTASIQDAEASRRGRVATGVAVGVLAGAVVAGAIASSRPARAEPVYVVPDCSEWRRQARYYERTDRYGRAEYYWDRYRECRGE
jgi:hypothetical protein